MLPRVVMSPRINAPANAIFEVSGCLYTPPLSKQIRVVSILGKFCETHIALYCDRALDIACPDSPTAFRKLSQLMLSTLRLTLVRLVPQFGPTVYIMATFRELPQGLLFSGKIVMETSPTGFSGRILGVAGRRPQKAIQSSQSHLSFLVKLSGLSHTNVPGDNVARSMSR